MFNFYSLSDAPPTSLLTQLSVREMLIWTPAEFVSLLNYRRPGSFILIETERESRNIKEKKHRVHETRMSLNDLVLGEETFVGKPNGNL